MKKIVCCALVLMLSTILVAAHAAAADKSDIAGRVMTWEKEYNAGNLAARPGHVRQRCLPHAAQPESGAGR